MRRIQWPGSGVLPKDQRVAATVAVALCVAHELGFALKAADEVVFMDQGVTVQQEAPATFFSTTNHPRPQFPQHAAALR